VSKETAVSDRSSYISSPLSLSSAMVAGSGCATGCIC